MVLENRTTPDIIEDIYHFYPILFDPRFGIHLYGLNRATSIRCTEKTISVIADGWYSGQIYRLVVTFNGDGEVELRMYETAVETPDTLRYRTTFDNHNTNYALRQLRTVLPYLNPQSGQFDPTYNRYGY